jgi:redox-sensitive bicupin YhaK (pirin superfamily)
MGTGSVIKPGEIQIMSAGSGIEHSEYNHSKSEILHFLQIWIIPDKSNLTPSYQQEKIKNVHDQFILIGANKKSDGIVHINQDVKLFAAYLTKNHDVQYPLEKGRVGWLQLIKGKIKLNDHEISQGDGVAIQGENVRIQCLENAELLFFDLSEK